MLLLQIPELPASIAQAFQSIGGVDESKKDPRKDPFYLYIRPKLVSWP